MLHYLRIIPAALLFFWSVSLAGAPQTSAETYRVYGVVSADVLYLRAKASTKSRKVGSIPPYGKGVRKLGPCKASWCKVSYHGMTGWASMKYLTREASAGTSYRVRGIKSWDVLFIRAWPSPKSRKVGSIPPDGRGVEKLGPCKANWCKISYRGITGWSSMMYLVADGATVPEPTPSKPDQVPAYPPPPPAPTYVPPTPPEPNLALPRPVNPPQSGGEDQHLAPIPDEPF